MRAGQRQASEHTLVHAQTRELAASVEPRLRPLHLPYPVASLLSLFITLVAYDFLLVQHFMSLNMFSCYNVYLYIWWYRRGPGGDEGGDMSLGPINKAGEARGKCDFCVAMAIGPSRLIHQPWCMCRWDAWQP